MVNAPSAATPAGNPLSGAALAIPIRTLRTANLLARILGAAFVLLYAIAQYQQFERSFPATWVFTVAIAIVALATAAPFPFRWATILHAGGAAILLFGGAALSREPWGIAAMLCGLLAWLATAAIAEQRGQPAFHAISGLVLGAMGTIALAVATALLVSN